VADGDDWRGGEVEDRLRRLNEMLAMDDVRSLGHLTQVADDRDAPLLEFKGWRAKMGRIHDGAVSAPQETQGDVAHDAFCPAPEIEAEVGDQNLQSRLIVHVLGSAWRRLWERQL